MDVSVSGDFPNPYGLHASDFDHDLESYAVALKFLSDLSGGTEQERALQINGADEALLQSWKSSSRFRKVLAKCRAAVAQEKAALEARETEAEQPKLPPPGSFGFVSFEDAPVQRRSLFA